MGAHMMANAQRDWMQALQYYLNVGEWHGGLND